MVRGLESFAVENVVRVECHMEETSIANDGARFVDATKALEGSISVLKVGQFYKVALGLWLASFKYQSSSYKLIPRTNSSQAVYLQIDSFDVESVKCNLNFLVLLSDEVVMTLYISRIEARIVWRSKVAVTLVHAVKVDFTVV